VKEIDPAIPTRCPGWFRAFLVDQALESWAYLEQMILYARPGAEQSSQIEVKDLVSTCQNKLFRAQAEVEVQSDSLVRRHRSVVGGVP